MSSFVRPSRLGRMGLLNGAGGVDSELMIFQMVVKKLKSATSTYV